MTTEQFFTVKEFAKIFKISVKHVCAEIKKGRLRALRIGDSNKSHYRIHESEFRRYRDEGIRKNMKQIEE